MKLCNDGVAYEVKSMKRLSLDLVALKDRITEATGMTAKICLPVLLLLEGSNGTTVNIFPEGRLLLRKFPDQSSAEEFVRLLSSAVF
ncbi:MAG: hypothetical protein ACTSV2_14070 [Candidatus Thorarchaeota archaeon]